MKIQITIALTFLMAASQIGFAQVTDSLNLGEFVVTASKITTTERETTKPVTIINRREIDRHPGASVSDILNRQNGIMINGSVSSPGKDKSVYLRGAATQYTLILIDGFPVTDPSSEGGAFDLRLFPLENVERIEIVKGSMSTLYGSDAIAGVINIITKKPEDGTFNLNAKAAYGSYNTNEFAAGANGRSGIANYNVSVSRHYTEGISEAEPVEGAAFNEDGYERLAGSIHVEVGPTENLKITPFLNYSEYNGDYDAGAFSDAENRYQATLLNFGYRLKLIMGDIEIRNASTLTETSRKFTDDFGVFDPEATLYNTDLFAVYNRFKPVRFLAGFNFQDLGFQLNGIDEGSQIISPYLTTYLRSEFGLNAELGLRLNSHSEYGTNWSFNIAPVFHLSEEFKLLASVSSGFKAPTLNELFGPFGANTSLKPQKSLTFDGGIEYRHLESGLSASIIYFQRNIEDLISYDSNIGYINVNEQNDSGVEVTARYNWDNTNLEVFYNYLDGAITQNGKKSDNLIRRPDHSFGLNLFQRFNSSLSVNLNSTFVGEREDLFFSMDTFQNESVTLDPYLLLNIGSKYVIIEERLTVFAEIKNILNAEYTEVYGFNTPGIHFKAGLQFSF